MALVGSHPLGPQVMLDGPQPATFIRDLRSCLLSQSQSPPTLQPHLHSGLPQVCLFTSLPAPFLPHVHSLPSVHPHLQSHRQGAFLALATFALAVARASSMSTESAPTHMLPA